MKSDHARRRLLEERSRLRALIDTESALAGGIARGAESELSHADRQFPDDASDVAEAETDLAIRRRLEIELDEVEAALERVDLGSYGICETCGKRIPDERLDVVPAARYCIEDQALQERQAAGRV